MRMTSKSSTTTELEMLDPITPGEILLHEFMEPHRLTQAQLARALGVNAGRLSEIIRGRPVKADIALRLSRYFGTTPDMWLALQMEYDLRRARRDIGALVSQQVQPLEAA